MSFVRRRRRRVQLVVCLWAAVVLGGVARAESATVGTRLALADVERNAFEAFERWWQLAQAVDVEPAVRSRARRRAAVLAHLLGFRARLERLIEADPEDPELAWLGAWLARRSGRATGWFWEPKARGRFGALPVRVRPCPPGRRVLVCLE